MSLLVYFAVARVALARPIATRQALGLLCIFIPGRRLGVTTELGRRLARGPVGRSVRRARPGATGAGGSRPQSLPKTSFDPQIQDLHMNNYGLGVDI